MYCVIQKMINKKANKYGCAKSLEVTTTTFQLPGEAPCTFYGYRYSEDRFERPNKDVYKISIHKSFRENGKVMKKQWVICTVDYYYLAENLWLGDCVNSKELEVKIHEMGISEEKFWDMVYEKLQPIIDIAAAEFKETEEFKTDENHNTILSLYSQAKDSFEEKYGPRTYDKCFDIFGVLRNEKYLRQLEESYEFQQKYNFSGSYSDFDFGNYSDSYHKNSSGNYNFGGYQNPKVSNYSEEDKQQLKKLYKMLALQFHPDRNGDAEMMKLLNRVKEDLGI